jgi:hypothetical protein
MKRGTKMRKLCFFLLVTLHIRSPELLKTFLTKQTPVFKVRFTRRNLLLAGGPFKTEEEKRVAVEVGNL